MKVLLEKGSIITVEDRRVEVDRDFTFTFINKDIENKKIFKEVDVVCKTLDIAYTIVCYKEAYLDFRCWDKDQDQELWEANKLGDLCKYLLTEKLEDVYFTKSVKNLRVSDYLEVLTFYESFYNFETELALLAMPSELMKKIREEGFYYNNKHPDARNNYFVKKIGKEKEIVFTNEFEEESDNFKVQRCQTVKVGGDKIEDGFLLKWKTASANIILIKDWWEFDKRSMVNGYTNRGIILKAFGDVDINSQVEITTCFTADGLPNPEMGGAEYIIKITKGENVLKALFPRKINEGNDEYLTRAVEKYPSIHKKIWI